MGGYSDEALSGGYKQGTQADGTTTAINNGQGTSGAELRGNYDIRQRVGRYQGLGAAAANRQAYEMDWKNADAARGQADASRGNQLDAYHMASGIASGQTPSQAQQLGQQMVQRGLQSQQAVALSRRGGSLAQAAALQRANANAGTFQAQAGQQLDMQRAQEMDAARRQAMELATNVRQGDLTGQDLSQQRVAAQQGVAIGQRQLNSQGQWGYEQMGNDEALNQLNSTVHDNAIAAQGQAAKEQADQADADRFNRYVGAGIGGGGAVVGGIASDGRAKQNVHSLSDAAAKREAYLLGRAHQNEQSTMGKPVEFAYGGPPKKGEDIVDKDPSKAAKPREMQAFSRGASTVDTALTPDDERAYQAWKKQYAPKDSGADYDLRGAFKAGIKPDPQSGHWPDTFKKPNHETFSDESQYAKQGRPGHWEGEKFTPAQTQSRMPVAPPGALQRGFDALGNQAGALATGPAGVALSTLDAQKAALVSAEGVGIITPGERQRTSAALSDERSKSSARKVDMTSALADGLAPHEWEYKPEFAAGEGQRDGEKNVGIIAQRAASNPVTGTIVEHDSPDGMLRINASKSNSLALAGVGHLAHSSQEHEARLKRLEKGGR